MHRRTLLRRTAPALAVAGLAGCLGDDESRLGTLSVQNRDDEPRTVDIRVVWEGELHSTTATLAPRDKDGNTVWPERTWPTGAGTFTVRARVGDGEWAEAAPEDWDSPDCLSLIVDVREGRAVFYGSVNDRGCSSG